MHEDLKTETQYTPSHREALPHVHSNAYGIYLGAGGQTYPSACRQPRLTCAESVRGGGAATVYRRRRELMGVVAARGG